MHTMVWRWHPARPLHPWRRHWRHRHTSRRPTLLLELYQELLIVINLVLNVLAALGVLLAAEG